MFFLSKPEHSYASVESFDCTDEEKNANRVLRRTGTSVKLSLCWALTLATLLCVSIASTWVLYFQKPLNGSLKEVSHSNVQWQCTRPVVRREWRTLNEVEKNAYVTAVQCLETKPSRVRNNGTLYDDFPWVHKHTSTNTHKASPFLPWHRYYIHVYEKALQDDCAYTGSLPYWDWSLDYEDFTKSPVWSPSTGFGGNGDIDSSVSVGEGHCVSNGPFAGLQAMFYDNEYEPHCLSRGFQSGAARTELGKLVQPEVIQDILNEDDFESFAQRVEKNAHQFASESIRGEFSKFTGPYDPVFFLHHTNLDRLWWTWQMMKPQERLHAYNGKANKNELRDASLGDELDLAGLRHGIPVADVMDTTTGIFCYQY